MAPRQKPGRSKQDYQTPPEFLDALKHKLGITDFWIDLAADEYNSVAGPMYYNEEMDALSRSWCSPMVGKECRWAFCNPPYANIAPWVEKACWEAAKGAYIAMLVPASVGANWWLCDVAYDAYVLFLNGRLTFVGETSPYPKDCAVLLYTPFTQGGNCVWNWREECVTTTPTPGTEMIAL